MSILDKDRSILDKPRRHEFLEIPDNHQNSFIWNINRLAARIDILKELNEKFGNTEDVQALIRLSTLELEAIINDVKKGIGQNGSRKLDVTLTNPCTKIIVTLIDGQTFTKVCVPNTPNGKVISASNLHDQFNDWSELTSQWGDTVLSVVSADTLRFSDTETGFSKIESVYVELEDGPNALISWNDTTSGILSTVNASANAQRAEKAAKESENCKIDSCECASEAQVAMNEASISERNALQYKNTVVQLASQVDTQTNQVNTAYNDFLNKYNAMGARCDVVTEYWNEIVAKYNDISNLDMTAQFRALSVSVAYEVSNLTEAVMQNNLNIGVVTQQFEDHQLASTGRFTNLSIASINNTSSIKEVSEQETHSLIYNVLSTARLVYIELTRALKEAKDYIIDTLNDVEIVRLKLADGTEIDSANIIFVSTDGTEIPLTDVTVNRRYGV